MGRILRVESEYSQMLRDTLILGPLLYRLCSADFHDFGPEASFYRHFSLVVRPWHVACVPQVEFFHKEYQPIGNFYPEAAQER